MASPVAMPSDWRKMKKEDLRLELAMRGLDTNGLRPSLIHRLESSCEAAAATTLGTENLPPGSVSNSSLNPDPNPNRDPVSNSSLNPDPNPNRDPNPSHPETQEASPLTHAFKINSTSNASKAQLSDLAPQVSKQAAQKSPDKPDFKERIYTGPSSSVTDLEKKQMRAERFGMQLRISEEEKRKMRASRFGGCVLNGKADVSEPETEKRKQRAARFGIVDDESRKKARQEWFSHLTVKRSHVSEVVKEKAGAAKDVDMNQLVETKDSLESNREP